MLLLEKEKERKITAMKYLDNWVTLVVTQNKTYVCVSFGRNKKNILGKNLLSVFGV